MFWVPTGQFGQILLLDLFCFYFIFAGDEEDVGKIENTEGVGDKKGDEPPFLGDARSLPQSTSFNRQSSYG